MKHHYSWSIDCNNTMTVWEDDCVLITIENCTEELNDCFDESLEQLFKNVVREMRGIDLDMEEN